MESITILIHFIYDFIWYTHFFQSNFPIIMPDSGVPMAESHDQRQNEFNVRVGDVTHNHSLYSSCSSKKLLSPFPQMAIRRNPLGATLQTIGSVQYQNTSCNSDKQTM